ncbi:GNAT family N-acetyltransferase [Bacillus sonorensis]|uniref:GNAT family N-acetyltransferase n=1 Tax=Bacillus sonorensis TaxID=119858 RepID=UPI001F1DC4C6|nr:GNAT family N-acetyltransferase [Bacillus sonorensis]MCF7618673.1 GNAT family N-acetyltransferase [Bacillus sonorensis]MCY7858898.1 GNAT family N-acetyltransferase [Bacillus sonorensis]
MGTKKIDLSKIKVRLIQVTDHQIIQNFKCGNSTIENYLKQNAYYDTIDSFSSTSLVFYKEDGEKEALVGFFTLKNVPLRIIITSDELYHNNSLEIARIAVDLKYQENGFGTIMINTIKTLAQTTNQRFVTLDALIERYDWYVKRGFEAFIENEAKRSNKDGLVYMYSDLLDEKAINAFIDDEQIV